MKGIRIAIVATSLLLILLLNCTRITIAENGSKSTESTETPQEKKNILVFKMSLIFNQG
jgi:hypothetical protein